MVGQFEPSGVWLPLFFGQSRSPLEKMDASARSDVVAALVTLTILGAILIVFAWLAARAARRYMSIPMHQSPAAPTSFEPDDWAKKPILPTDDDPLDSSQENGHG